MLLCYNKSNRRVEHGNDACREHPDVPQKKALLSLNTAKSVAMESRNKYPLGDIYFEVPLMGNFLIIGKTKATNFLRLIAFGFIII